MTQSRWGDILVLFFFAVLLVIPVKSMTSHHAATDFPLSISQERFQ
ncbi:MAG: hypothetical protein HC834_00375 [Rhodospirillales bacterium]|nr:hypothetical protein [Rhodospirillales bacterium]